MTEISKQRAHQKVYHYRNNFSDGSEVERRYLSVIIPIPMLAIPEARLATRGQTTIYDGRKDQVSSLEMHRDSGMDG